MKVGQVFRLCRLLLRALYRGPGRHVAEEIGQHPGALDIHFRRVALGEREAQVAIATVDEFALGRPVGADLVVIETVEAIPQLGGDIEHAIGDEGDDGAVGAI